MRYHYRERIKIKQKRSKKPLLVLPVMGAAAGLYAVLLVFSPVIFVGSGDGGEIRQRLMAAPEMGENWLYIPKINVSEPITGNQPYALRTGVWHRKPRQGNPREGDNFIVCAPQLSLGWTPQQTQARSPFYYLGKLATGDKIFVDYQGERYAYKVRKQLRTLPENIRMTDTFEKAIMTLYPCTPAGIPQDGKVLVAKPLGQVEKVRVSKT